MYIFEKFCSFGINISMHIVHTHTHAKSQTKSIYFVYGLLIMTIDFSRVPFKLWAVLCKFAMISSRVATTNGLPNTTHSFTWLDSTRQRSHSHTLHVCESYVVHTNLNINGNVDQKTDKALVSVGTTIAYILNHYFNNKMKKRVLDSLAEVFYARFIAIFGQCYTIAVTDA